jgi:protein associated with RNAse G/E
MKAGDEIQVCACKTDGTVYRSSHTTIESVDTGSIVTISPAGSMVIDKTKLGDHPLKHHLRSYYWFDKFYNLIEVFDVDGPLVEIYINIASPPEFENGIMSFKDHELDVDRHLPDLAELIDEDEFAEAIITYHYTKEFQEKMYSAANEALELANHWIARPAPDFGGNHVE